MKIIATKEQLLRPLALVAGAADTRGVVPMLGTVLLKADGKGHLSMVCSDTGALLKAMAPVDVAQDVEIAVDVRRINELVRALPNKQTLEMSLEAKKRALLVECGRSCFRLPTLPAKDYPRMSPVSETRVSFQMNARRLAEMLSEVACAMAANWVFAWLSQALRYGRIGYAGVFSTLTLDIAPQFLPDRTLLVLPNETSVRR